MKSIFTLLLVAVFSIQGFSQETGFLYGFRGGLGQSTVSNDAISEATGKLMWQIGGASRFQFNKRFAVSADILLSEVGDKGQGETEEGGITGSTIYKYKEKISIFSANVPLMANLFLGSSSFRAKVFAGVDIGFNLNGLYTRVYDDPDYNAKNGVSGAVDGMPVMSQSVLYGVGMEAKAGSGKWYYLDFRMSQGLTDLGNINGKSFKNNFFALHVGYYLSPI